MLGLSHICCGEAQNAIVIPHIHLLVTRCIPSGKGMCPSLGTFTHSKERARLRQRSSAKAITATDTPAGYNRKRRIRNHEAALFYDYRVHSMPKHVIMPSSEGGSRSKTSHKKLLLCTNIMLDNCHPAMQAVMHMQ